VINDFTTNYFLLSHKLLNIKESGGEITLPVLTKLNRALKKLTVP